MGDKSDMIEAQIRHALHAVQEARHEAERIRAAKPEQRSLTRWKRLEEHQSKAYFVLDFLADHLYYERLREPKRDGPPEFNIEGTALGDAFKKHTEGS